MLLLPKLYESFETLGCPDLDSLAYSYLQNDPAKQNVIQFIYHLSVSACIFNDFEILIFNWK